MQLWKTLLATVSSLTAAVVSCTDDGADRDQAISGGTQGKAASAHAGNRFDPHDPAASGMILTFDDEFNALSVSDDGPAHQTRWTEINPRPNVSVHDGVLDITTADDGKGWTAGELISINRRGEGFGQRFGYFEARIRCSGSGGTFYLMSQAHIQNNSAPAAELDVLESDPLGHPTHMLATLHLSSGTPADRQNAATGGSPFVNVRVPIAEGFHTYSVLWDPKAPSITWFFDGKPVMTQPKYPTTDLAPMFLNISGGIGVQQGVAQRAGEKVPNPSHVYIDYVRVWQFADENPTAVAPEPVSPPGGEPARDGSVLPSSRAASGSSTSR